MEALRLLKLALPGLILKEVYSAMGSVFTGTGWVSHLCRMSFLWLSCAMLPLWRKASSLFFCFRENRRLGLNRLSMVNEWYFLWTQ